MALMELAVDFGSSYITIYKRGEGIVLKEASVVVVSTHKKKREVVESGNAAKNYVRTTMGNAREIYPVREGVVVSVEDASLMMSEFIKRLLPEKIFKPQIRAVVMISSGLTVVERRDVETVMLNAGVKDVILVESPLALLAYTNSVGGLFLDIGGGTTEIAVVSMGGVAECESIKTAGSTFDEAIIRYIKKKHNMLIGAMTAEDVKINIGGVYPRSDAPESMEVKGRDLIKGLPKTVSVTAEELVDVLREPARLILENVHAVLERTPPELIGDLGVNGMILSGGGSLLYGIDRMIEDSTHIRTMIVDDPLACAAHGAGKLLTKLDSMQDGMMNFLRNREMRN